MSKHPGKIHFQFTQAEVETADITRFSALFEHLGTSPETVPVLRHLCGAVSIGFDPELAKESESALLHPKFHAFAQEFFKACPWLPFLINLENASFWLLFLGALDHLTKIEVTSSPEIRWKFDRAEFCDRGEACKAQVIVYAEKADMEYEDAVVRRRLVESYLLDTESSYQLRW